MILEKQYKQNSLETNKKNFKNENKTEKKTIDNKQNAIEEYKENILKQVNSAISINSTQIDSIPGLKIRNDNDKDNLIENFNNVINNTETINNFNSTENFDN